MGTELANDARSQPRPVSIDNRHISRPVPLDVLPRKCHGYGKECKEDREREQDIICRHCLAKVFGEVVRKRCDKYAPRVNRAQAQVDEHADDDKHPAPFFRFDSHDRFRYTFRHSVVS